ncbi:DivIVA domain-containing protein [Emticicia sp. 21SJ11W-3]|uniref:DivIVA domain-containing protein n=1 Tax=Emticicia sp. 21SJ11W-3 TaxID=2916755 RepID=UPI0020A11AC3|nr:DivIVA domain-containing protein [Emticicia sp. 21SJ11W-3]UTA69731.1 DivIVA domain-containing protein [Emticicia sp. 21SJ11W-3]
MKITPLEIRQHEFEKTFRGYNIEEVDNFLANLSQEWERILNESKMLRMQLEMAEKEASKLREIEMTLFKTLKTAEDTSTMITEQANQQADKNIQDARQKSQEILRDAQLEADKVIQEAQDRARYIKEEVLGEVKELEKDFKMMYQYKTDLLVQMRSLSMSTLEHVQRLEEKFKNENVDEKIQEAFNTFVDEKSAIPTFNIQEELSYFESKTAQVTAEKLVYNISKVEDTSDHIPEEVTAIQPASAALISETPAPEAATLAEDEEGRSDELGIIEGIGPKIAMLLYDSGIFTFRGLATTPVERIKEILDNAGPAYAMHDPTTWVEQALLAAEGRFDELEEMKSLLVGGKAEEDVEEKGIDNSVSMPEAALPEITQEKTSIPEPVATKAAPVASNLDSVTEEMLEKVNKVKEAVRKAMVEKEEKNIKDNTPLPKVNEILAKNSDIGGGSFFDNI